MTSPTPPTVLVTGGSGFIATYVLLSLLSSPQNYTILTTLRSLASSRTSVLSSLLNGGASESSLNRLSFIEADLSSDKNWDDACEGVTYIHHIAGPFPPGVPSNEDDLIKPTLDGTMRVLRAAVKAGVKRVILTSSLKACEYGQPSRTPRTAPFTEEDWTSLSNSKIKVWPYAKAKTITERAAWEFINSNENINGMELTVVIPVYTAGPILKPTITTSLIIIKSLLDGSMPACPKISWPYIDIRDLATLHILCMTVPEAAGERFMGVNNDPPISIMEMGKLVTEKRGERGGNVPRFELPNWFVWVMSWFNRDLGQILPDIGRRGMASNEKARRVLGWVPVRGTEDSLLEAVDSLVKFGVV